MPAIKPVSDLRNYTDVLQDVAPGSPVFLTRNGRGVYAIVDMADFDREAAAHTLLDELDRGRASGNDQGWITEKDVRAHMADTSSHA